MNGDRTKTKLNRESSVVVPVGRAELKGRLAPPPSTNGESGLVVLPHAGHSKREQPDDRAIAKILNESGLGTLAIALLTDEEVAVDALTAGLRFDIGLLTERLVGVIDSLRSHPQSGAASIGYFGDATGAAAALCAAAERPQDVQAIVSRDGRPDLARDHLHRVHAPTLLTVAEHDAQLVGLNREALIELRCEKHLVIVPGATRLCTEPGALEHVARLAADWFRTHFHVPPESFQPAPRV